MWKVEGRELRGGVENQKIVDEKNGYTFIIEWYGGIFAVDH